MHKPVIEQPHPSGHPVLDSGGIQKIYRFDNGYGASVVQFHGSYGYSDGLWELAVIVFTGDADSEFNLTYDTPITDDTIGHLTKWDAEKILNEIAALPVNPNDKGMSRAKLDAKMQDIFKDLSDYLCTKNL